MKKKILVFLLIVAVLFLLVFKGVPFFVNLYLNNNAEKIVTDMITKTSDFGNHEVTFGEIRLDYDYRGTYLQLDSVNIVPDQNIPEDKVKFYLTANRISLTGFSWMSYLFDNSLKIDSAVLHRINIESITPDLDSMEFTNGGEREGNDYNAIGVQHIRLVQMSLKNTDSHNDSTRLEMVDLTVSADNFLFDKEDLESQKSLFSVAVAEGTLKNVAIHFDKYRNTVFAFDLSFDTSDSTMKVGKLALDNKLGKYEYTALFEKEANWMELKKAKLGLLGIDFHTFFREGIIKAKNLELDSMEILVFRDKRKPENFENNPKMIHEIFSELPQKLHIDRLELSNGFVEYDERPDKQTPRSGKIYFDQINASIQNMTNLKDSLEANNEMDLRARGRLMGTGQIDLEVKYFLEDSTGRFLMKGSIESMELNRLNHMLEPAAQVAIRSGRLNNLYFNIDANDLEGTGDVIMKYEDLEIDLLGKDLKDQNILHKIGSFLANKLVIPSQNPDKKGELKEGIVYYIRDQHKFIFNYWWELILSGAKSTFTGQTEEEMREKAKD